MISVPVLNPVILATFKGLLVQRPLEAQVDPHNHFKASKLTKNRIQSQNTPNTDPPRGSMIFGPALKWFILDTFKGQLVQRPLEALGDLHNQSKASKLTKYRIQSQNTPNTDPPRGSLIFGPALKWFILDIFKASKLKSTLSPYPPWALTQLKSQSTLTSSFVFCQF